LEIILKTKNKRNRYYINYLHKTIRRVYSCVVLDRNYYSWRIADEDDKLTYNVDFLADLIDLKDKQLSSMITLIINTIIKSKSNLHYSKQFEINEAEILVLKQQLEDYDKSFNRSFNVTRGIAEKLATLSYKGASKHVISLYYKDKKKSRWYFKHFTCLEYEYDSGWYNPHFSTSNNLYETIKSSNKSKQNFGWYSSSTHSIHTPTSHKLNRKLMRRKDRLIQKEILQNEIKDYDSISS
jgi:uncharacterized membrane-anchored protein YhcB (DUF1043 family)